MWQTERRVPPRYWRTWALLCSTLALGWLGVACKGRQNVTGLGALDAKTIDAHLLFLASDLLEGRAPGTRGAELAASYIATQFAQAGLKPAIGDTSYFQAVPMIARSSEPRLSFRASGGATLTPPLGDGFLAWPLDTAAVTAVEAELVFVGFGIAAPEYEWDDYKDADVRGKVLLALDGAPGPDRGTRFPGDTATRYGSPLYKYAEAESRGAEGMLLVHSPDLGYVWDAIRSVRAAEQLSLAGVRATDTRVAGWITGEVASQVAAMGGLNFPTLLEAAGNPDFRPIDMGVTVSLSAQSRERAFEAANVAGLLPGRDPELARELVVFVAHYDHLGVDTRLKDDSIYNGAYDNASGTALLVELAEAFGSLPRHPARSLLFLAVTGTEAGCLGSRYYLRHPVVPLPRTVASLQIDGANLWGPTEDIVLVWADGAEMGEAVRKSVSAEGLRLEAAVAPEWGIAYRSDHPCFSEAGVPSVFVGHGLEFVGRMPGWGRQTMEQYLRTAYLRPGDEYQAGLDLRGAVQQARVAFRLGLYLSNARWQGRSDDLRSEEGEASIDARGDAGRRRARSSGA